MCSKEESESKKADGKDREILYIIYDIKLYRISAGSKKEIGRRLWNKVDNNYSFHLYG